MAIVVTVTSVEYPEDGSVRINFSDSTQLEFSDRASVVSYGNEANDPEFLRKMLVRAWLHRSANANNPSWVAGKTAQLDLSLELNQLSIGEV